MLLARRLLDGGDRRCIGGVARFAMFPRLARLTRFATGAARALATATAFAAAAFASTTTAAATAATAAVGCLEARGFKAGNLDAGNGRADQLLDRLHEVALRRASPG